MDDARRNAYQILKTARAAWREELNFVMESCTPSPILHELTLAYQEADRAFMAVCRGYRLQPLSQ